MKMNTLKQLGYYFIDYTIESIVIDNMMTSLRFTGRMHVSNLILLLSLLLKSVCLHKLLFHAKLGFLYGKRRSTKRKKKKKKMMIFITYYFNKFTVLPVIVKTENCAPAIILFIA